MAMHNLSLVLMVLAFAAGATQVDFWNEYAPPPADKALYLLAQFNGKPAPLGAVARVRSAGDAALTKDGRFGGALQVRGAGAAVVEMAETFPGGFIAVEAWVKLDRLPDDEGCVVCRPAVVDKSATYNPEVDRSKGWKLIVDHAGALHLETTNTFYGNTTRTSSPAGVVPVGKWVHLAGISVGFPYGFRRLYRDGECVGDELIAWGQGLVVGSDQDLDPQPVYIGNNADGTAGLSGLIDQVRIHREVFRFWPNELDRFRVPTDRAIPDGPPYFVAGHQPVAVVPLDGNTDARTSIDGLTVTLGEGATFVPGVRGQAVRGKLALVGPGLVDLREATIEFWVRAVDINNWSDRNFGILNFHPANFYIFNGGNGPRALSLYWSIPGGLNFVSTNPAPDFGPGRWLHVCLAWRGNETAVYVDGEERGRTLTESLAEAGKRDVTDGLVFSGYGQHLDVDEVRVYNQCLTPDEIANACHRYLEPDKLIDGVREESVAITGQFLPSYRLLTYRLRANRPVERVRLTLVGPTGQLMQREEAYGEDERETSLPPLADGDYRLRVDALPDDPGGTFHFVRKHFAWEGNDLGKTDRVFAPFTPVTVDGPEVGIVGRRYRLNGFGLCDQVESLGRELLAAPMSIQAETAEWKLGWKFSARWLARQDDRAVWQATAANDVVKLTTTTSIDVDGCATVVMRLEPGPKPAELLHMTLDIPLKNSEASLHHAIANGLRQNPSGFLPPGDGVVFDGSKLARAGAWRNNFVPYIWLGGAIRGLAVFAENDYGWITEKDKSNTPTHEVIRAGDVLTLRLHLVNHPATVAAPRELVFGFQASPTKPMPADWRAKLAVQQGGLAVVPWGGLQCPSQGPYADDWTIVDKILEPRSGKPFDRDWLAAYVAERRPPPVHGTWDWANSVGHFAGRVKDRPDIPIGCYHEEMAASVMRPEWVVFQDEWTAADGPRNRRHVAFAELGTGQTELGGGAGITFSQSYRDFSVWMANEWLKRGVTLYWDNTYLKLATNTRTTAAYVGEDGQIQPALVLWNQRAYQRRVWNVLQEQREKVANPLEWTIHMTNTLVLPVHGWATADLDHELGRETPFPPDWLRTETTGLQVGNYGLSLYPVTGRGNETIAAQGKDYVAHSEWAMRITHNIDHNQVIPVAEAVREFGDADPAVPLHNYWADAPAAAVDRDDVKWVILTHPAAREAVVILASWATDEAAVTLTFAPDVLGFDPAGLRVVDLVDGSPVADRVGDGVTLTIPGPWGMRALRLTP